MSRKRIADASADAANARKKRDVTIYTPPMRYGGLPVPTIANTATQELVALGVWKRCEFINTAYMRVAIILVKPPAIAAPATLYAIQTASRSDYEDMRLDWLDGVRHATDAAGMSEPRRLYDARADGQCQVISEMHAVLYTDKSDEELPGIVELYEVPFYESVRAACRGPAGATFVDAISKALDAVPKYAKIDMNASIDNGFTLAHAIALYSPPCIESRYETPPLIKNIVTRGSKQKITPSGWYPEALALARHVAPELVLADLPEGWTREFFTEKEDKSFTHAITHFAGVPVGLHPRLHPDVFKLLIWNDRTLYYTPALNIHTPESVRSNGVSLLHVAAARGLEYAAVYLAKKIAERDALKLDADKAAADFDGEHPLDTCYDGEALRAWGVRGGDTPLVAAARSGARVVIELLIRLGARASAPTPLGVTPLHVAVEEGRVNVATLLLARGADPTARARDVDTLDAARIAANAGLGPEGGLTPLHVAVSASACAPDVRARLAKVLLANGADPNAGAYDVGRTPLHMAVGTCDEAMVRLLLEYGADPRARSCGQTPHDMALEIDDAAPLRALLAPAR